MAAAHNKPPIDQTNDEWLEAHSGKSNLIPNQALEALKPRVTVKSIEIAFLLPVSMLKRQNHILKINLF